MGSGLPDKTEFVNRSMDRLMATAKYGKQPRRNSEQTVISVKGKSGKDVSVAFVLADTEAVFDELEAGAPCGICHANPCAYKQPADTLA